MSVRFTCECSIASIANQRSQQIRSYITNHSKGKVQSVQISDIELRIMLRVLYAKFQTPAQGIRYAQQSIAVPYICLCLKRPTAAGKKVKPPDYRSSSITSPSTIYGCAKIASVAQKLLRLSSSLTRPLPLEVIMLTEALDESPNQLTLVELEISLMCSWQSCPGTHSCA